MDRDVNPKTAIIIISYFICLIAVWAHFNAEKLSLDAPSFIKHHPNGNLLFKIGNHYYESTPEGEDVYQFDLSTVDISQTIGDFDLFSNGELLFYATTHQPNFIERLSVFMRSSDSLEHTALNGEGFYRCNMYKSLCYRFATNLPTFRRGFRLEVDINDNVYIADTSRHRVIKTNSIGEDISYFEKKLKFPNDIYWEDDNIFIVNTNHHEVLRVNVKTSEFSQDIKRFPVSLPNRKYPSDIERLENGWLALTMNNQMKKGTLIKLNEDLELTNTINIDRGSDITGIILSKNKIILPDFKNMHFKTLNANSMKPEGNFETPEIKKHLTESINSRKKIDVICWSIIGSGIISFIILAFIAIRSEIRASEKDINKLAKSASNNDKLPEGVTEYWIPKSSQFINAQKSMRWLIPICVALIAILCALAIQEKSINNTLLAYGFMLFAILYIIKKLTSKVERMGLGLSSKGVLIRDHQGNIYSGQGSKIKISSSAIVIENFIVMKGIFDNVEFERWITPQIKNAKKVSELQVIIKQWKIKHPALIEPIKLALISLAFIGVTELMGIT